MRRMTLAARRARIYLRRPGRMRVEYDPPSEILLIADGILLVRARDVAVVCGLALIPCALIYLEPDLGSTLVYVAITVKPRRASGRHEDRSYLWSVFVRELALLGHHADAVPLAQAAEEVFLRPGEVEAELLGLKHLRHVAADHPADMDAQLLLWVGAHVRPPSLSAL